MADVRKAGIVGWPVTHSLSPKLHRYWLDKYRIPGEYVALAVEPENLAHKISALPKQGFCGFNVTVPHKEKIMPLLDAVDEAARAIGAVNMVTITQGKMQGTNSDGYGFIASLKQGGMPKFKNKAVVLGAGGAAKAVVKMLGNEGFSHIVIVCRVLEKGIRIRDGAFGKNKNITVEPWERRAETLADADLLVNATSLGMQSGAALKIDLQWLPGAATVMDLIYAPLETPLLAQAKARGNAAIDGLGMLMHQAVPAFEAWFGVRPEVDQATREHLLHA